jgi:molybdopterin-binding protein
MKYGARNQLIGTVTDVKKGAVMSQVKFTVESSAEMSSVLTVESVDDLNLKPGDKVRAIVKAIHVLLVKE